MKRDIDTSDMQVNYLKDEIVVLEKSIKMYKARLSEIEQAKKEQEQSDIELWEIRKGMCGLEAFSSSDDDREHISHLIENDIDGYTFVGFLHKDGYVCGDFTRNEYEDGDLCRFATLEQLQSGEFKEVHATHAVMRRTK